MKVALDDYGDLVVSPENQTERLALAEWVRRRENQTGVSFVIKHDCAPLPPRPAPSVHRREF